MDEKKDEALAREAVAKGYLSGDALEDCRRTQAELARRGQKVLLSQILVKRKLLDSETIRDLLREVPEREKPASRYEVGEKLGEGAMAVVYRGIDRQLNRPVALKVLKDVTRVERRRRFQREAHAVARLSHPNVVGVYDIQEEGGELRLVMELVEGESLDVLLAQRKLGAHAFVRLMAKIARGVEAAHAAGIVHRDLKPSNVRIAESGEPKVLDFGLAHLAETEASALTRTGARLGTPLYMAPEQIAGKSDAIGPSTDVYALGAILYEGLAGRVPFLGTNTTEVFHRISNEDPVPPSKLRRGLDRDLEAVVLVALEKEPRRRYPSAGALAEDLERWLEGEPVSARPPGTFVRFLRGLRKRRAIVLAAAAVLVAAAGTLVSLRWLEFRDARDEAQAAQAVGDWPRALAAAERALAIRRDAGLEELAEDCRGRIEGELSSTRRRLAHGEAYQRLRERMKPVERLIQETRPFFYVAAIDIRAKLEKVEAALAELETVAGDPDFREYPEVHELLGAGRYLTGDGAAAEARLLEALRLGSESGWVHYYLARIYLERSIFELLGGVAPMEEKRRRSREWSSRAHEHLERPEASGWIGAEEIERAIVRGYRALSEGADDEVVRLASEAISRFGGEPGAEEFYNLLGWVEGTRDRARQVELFTRALEIRPHYPWAHFMRAAAHLDRGELREALADYDRAIALYPSFILAYSNRGLCRRGLGDARGAVEDLDRVLAAQPDLVPALVNRGLAREDLGDLEGALSDFEEAIRRAPDLAAPYNDRGLLFLARHDLDGALADFQKAIELDPFLADAYPNRATARIRRRETDLALAEAEAGIERLPGRAAPRVARALVRRAAGDVPGALADLDEAIRLEPNQPNSFMERATLRYEAGDQDGAFADFDRTIELAPGKAEAYTDRGIIKLARDDPAGALADHDRAIELEPGLGAAYTNRGSVHLVLGNLPRAFADFDRAVELSPEAPEPVASRALARASTGDWAGAVSDLERALAIAPPAWPARGQAEAMLEDFRRRR